MRRLFLGETDYQTVEAVRAAEVPSIRAQNPEVPEELERIIRKSLTRDVNDRYRTAAEFADDLLDVLFSHRLKVSARDLSALLSELRQVKEAKEAKEKAEGKREMTLIEQLMAEELANFRSIDEDSGEGDAGATGSQSLLDDEFDSSAPLVEGLDDLIGPGPEHPPVPPSRPSSGPIGSPGSGPISSPGSGPISAPGSGPISAPHTSAGADSPIPTAPEDLPDPDDPSVVGDTSVAPTRLPSPPPRETKSNAGIWVLIVLLLVGGSAVAAWYLKLIPGL
jgi:serine/threonine protein kinase